ncbi:PP2C family protein-serine/threonine phosphatase [Enterocloster sp.]|uniref:PP2C family protein-serine/threonine phosphatase n=1 Tax=Enterocloster sp. TaxID=2719315 RepID=UPI0039A1255D
MERSIDQSLTQNLLEAEKIPLDQAAAHEARNNLYSYLGERGTPHIQISKKIKLENGDIFTVLSRGVWERCSDQELLEFANEAKEPQEILDQTEDLILKAQEETNIDNYTWQSPL